MGEPRENLTVAVTGPTGEVGKPFMRCLEREDSVSTILGMARSPFDPAEHGWTKTEYRQGDILDREAIDALVAEADVVVHLAFIVVKATSDTFDINIEGSRNVFEAAAASSAKRLVYSSSVAAYGYHEDAETPLREDMPTRGTDLHAYSRQKAEVERVLNEATDGSDIDVYTFRPCIVAGPEAPALINLMPYTRLRELVPDLLTAAVSSVPLVKPVLPDHGIPFQLVHHDDVATALVAGVLGRGEAGIYNLAADDEITLSDVARAMGWRSVPVPRAAVTASAKVAGRIPPLEVEAGWLEALRIPMTMSSERAHSELGWEPQYSSAQALIEMANSQKH